MTHNSLKLPKLLARLVAALALGAVFCAAALGAERLLWPAALESFGHLLYKLVYWLCFPLWMLLRVAIEPREDHHWPLYIWVVAAFASAILYYALAEWLLRRRRAQSPAAPEPPESQPPPQPAPQQPATPLTRREFFARASAGAFILAGGATLTWGSFIEPLRLKVRRFEIPIAGLPPALDGLTVGHFADSHYGPYVSLPFIQRAIARLNALQPDLIVLAGDYVHRTTRAIPQGIGVLAALKARLGIVAVLGNHDHWEDAAAIRRRFRQIGIPLLDNDRRFLSPAGLSAEPDADAICVAGVGDLWEDWQGFEPALGGVPAAMPRLLLSHNPDAAERVPESLRIDLMLSGHTHGGQVRIPGLGTPVVPSAFGQKYAGGLVAGPRCPVVVTRGVGMTILPLRLGVPPEIGLITLRGNKSNER